MLTTIITILLLMLVCRTQCQASAYFIYTTYYSNVDGLIHKASILPGSMDCWKLMTRQGCVGCPLRAGTSLREGRMVKWCEAWDAWCQSFKRGWLYYVVVNERPMPVHQGFPHQAKCYFHPRCSQCTAVLFALILGLKHDLHGYSLVW